MRKLFFILPLIAGLMAVSAVAAAESATKVEDATTIDAAATKQLSVVAHSGRTDKCGGHHDRKRGGYHVHNKVKYCRCYPDANVCKKN